MNISKKALMSFLMALTSLIAMAQPYYHVMKQDGNKLTEEAMYDGGTYKIKIDMNKPKPKDAIGGQITIEYSTKCKCHNVSTPTNFYFTNKGNVYYDRGLHFEKSQLDYSHSSNHIGLFRWGRYLDDCLTGRSFRVYWNSTQTFYFANPKNLRNIDGTGQWYLLSSCEWDYVCKNLGECGWTVDGKTCYLIDTTPGKSLLRTIESIKGEKAMSREDFEYYENKGLVCLPASGWARNYNNTYGHGYSGYYWSSTPSLNSIEHAWCMQFNSWTADIWGDYRSESYALRLVKSAL